MSLFLYIPRMFHQQLLYFQYSLKRSQTCLNPRSYANSQQCQKSNRFDVCGGHSWQLKQYLYLQMVDLYRQMIAVVQTMIRIDWMIAVVQTMVRIDWMIVLPLWKHAPIRALCLCRHFFFPFDPSDPFPFASSFLLALL